MNDKELFENNCLPLFWLEDEEHFEQIKANCNNIEEKRKKHKKITKIYNTLISKLFCNCENFEGVKNEKTN